MRLVRYVAGGQILIGVVLNNTVIAMNHILGSAAPSDLKELLALGKPFLSNLEELLLQPDVGKLPSLPVDGVKLLAPIADPSKIIAIGQNYLDHCREQQVEPPVRPLIFAKFPSSIIGANDNICWSEALSSKVDFEAELAVVIGEQCKGVSAQDAAEYIGAYTIANDVTARDLQYGDKQWVRGKSLDTFCPLGPYLVTASEISNPNALTISSYLNGELMQDSNTAEMIFRVDELVSFVSQHFTLYPGDIILTGTPNGVGVFRKPKVFMKDGDIIKIKIEKLGELVNTCSVNTCSVNTGSVNTGHVNTGSVNTSEVKD